MSRDPHGVIPKPAAPSVPARPLLPQMQVAPIHFEDLSGEQFERLCFAYALRYPEFVRVEWSGQSGGDDGKDVVAHDASGDAFIFQCANYRGVTFKKVKTDIGKIMAALPDRLRALRVVAGGKVSAALKVKIAAEAKAKLNVHDTEVWGAVEFEERLRLRAPDLLRRFVNGEAFPESPEALRALTESESNPPDVEIITALMRSFDRPAFRTVFLGESSLPRFKLALAETVNTLNTGQLPSGAMIPSRHAVRDAASKAALAQLVEKVVGLRAKFDELIRKKEIVQCSCGAPDCPVFMLHGRTAEIMDTQRQLILSAVRKLAPEAPATFYAV